jgi:hypothetical protein
MGIDLAAIEGTAAMEVAVDASGLPLLITIHGATVDVSASTLDAYRGLVLSGGVDHPRQLRKPGEINTPKGEQISDPSEFG